MPAFVTIYFKITSLFMESALQAESILWDNQENVGGRQGLTRDHTMVHHALATWAWDFCFTLISNSLALFTCPIRAEDARFLIV